MGTVGGLYDSHLGDDALLFKVGVRWRREGGGLLEKYVSSAYLARAGARYYHFWRLGMGDARKERPVPVSNNLLT